MSARRILEREARVAISRRAQPAWFRLLKWALVIVISMRLWPTRYFWWWIFGALAVSLTLHFIWRWKTNGWTHPWGGWNDIEAADKD